MKAMKTAVAACIVVLFATLGTVQAGPGGCCKKAQKKEEACSHKCCVTAAKEGNWCTKCGGEGKMPKKEENKDKK